MKRFAISGGTVVTPDRVIEDGEILILGRKIEGVEKAGAFDTVKDLQRIDVRGGIVVPGFIDAHTQGGAGYDFMEASGEELNHILDWQLSTGVTTVLPTISPTNLEDQLAVAGRIHQMKQRRPMIAGIHFEGPYLDPDQCAPQLHRLLRTPNVEEVARLIDASGHDIRLMTLAPELDGAEVVIRQLLKEGIITSAGHTSVTYDEFLAAVELGLSRATHLFNAMPSLHHRNPGPIAAALLNDNVFVEIILDGVHLHPVTIKLTTRLKGVDRVVLVTDATQAAGLGDGEYLRPGNRKVIVKDGIARLESGNLAGSTLTMDQAVRNAVSLIGFSIQDAVCMATKTAADSLNISDTKGRLEPGKDADILILDQNLQVRMTLLQGEIVYQHECDRIQ